MKVSVPIYITSTPRPGSRQVVYALRPLFFTEIERTDDNLSRGTRALVADLQKTMSKMARQGKHRQVAEWCFCPELEHHRYKLEIALKTTFFRHPFSVVTFREFDRRIGMVPTIPGFWFEINRSESPRDRAQQLLTELFEKRDRDGDSLDQLRNWWGVGGKAWVTTLEFDIETQQRVKSFDRSLLSFLSSGEQMDGATELDKTGRCLDRLYPEDLDRCVQRDDLVEELTRLLSAKDRRPVLLVGPRGSGKTALIHEHLFRRLEKNQARFRSKGNLWLLSPQRLISGMSFVGQWENRFIEILKHARKRKHVLCFDDLVGLFRAGVSRESDLCVADLLKPHLEERDVRVLAEITPEALGRLRELDRSFVDQFHVLRVAEPQLERSVLVLLEVVRQLERQHRCRFAVDVVPTVIDLCRRFLRGTAFPGKAAKLLRQMATKRPDQEITRDKVLSDFRAQTGLNAAFVDTSKRLPRDAIIAGLREMMVGQDAAVNAAADVISVARARLNDPDRPFGSFLFLGPTGVGKTQCAKAVANYLFGDADRLIRFDMNEFLTPDAVSGLVGTVGAPEGLLTSAIRRQPFSVLLLDEIEKAHPDAFDLLLQVLGDGRLTDAMGRTADFSSTIVIMTSNLGSRQAQATLGFMRTESERDHTFVRAAENFFRPEFFNRIDHAIPFDALTRDEVRQIARRHIEALCLREGLLRRRCILHPHDSVADAVIKAGFEPKWGARGVRRFIETRILRPVAVELAAHAAVRPTVVGVRMHERDVDVTIRELIDTPRMSGTIADLPAGGPDDFIERLTECLGRIDARCHASRPEGAISTADIRPEQYHYLEVTECLSALRAACQTLIEHRDERVHERIGESGGLANTMVTARRATRFHDWRLDHGPHDSSVMPEMFAADDIGSYIKEATDTTPDEGPSHWRPLVRNAALMDAVVPDGGDWNDQRVVVVIRSLQVAPRELYGLFTRYVRGGTFAFPSSDAHELVTFSLQSTALVDQEASLADNDNLKRRSTDGAINPRSPIPVELQQACRDVQCLGLQFEGLCADRLVQSEVGTHLVVQKNGRLLPMQLVSMPLDDGESAASVIERVVSELTTGCRDCEEPLFELKPVVRVYNGNKGILDLNTGESGGNVSSLITASLPLPEEFAAETE